MAAKSIGLMVHDLRRFRIVAAFSNRAINELSDSLLNYRQRNQKPFTRRNFEPEAILQLQIQTRAREKHVKQHHQPLPVDIRQLEGRHELHVGKQTGRIPLRVGDAASVAPTGVPLKSPPTRQNQTKRRVS